MSLSRPSTRTFAGTKGPLPTHPFLPSGRLYNRRLSPDHIPMMAFSRPIRRVFACVFFVALCCNAQAALPPGVSQGPSVEGITEYDLANGLKVLLFPDASQAKTTVNITYLVGSRMENYGETGMAHLLEHMVFKGTPSRGNLMSAMGQRGIDFNGTTWLDRT